MRVVRGGALSLRSREELLRLSEMQPPQPHFGARAPRLPAGPGRALRDRRRGAPGRYAEIQGQPPLYRAAAGSAHRDFGGGRAHRHAGKPEDAARGGGGFRVRLSRRLHGLGRRRAFRARRAGVPRAAPALPLHYRDWRRPHAGRRAIAHADGKNVRRAHAAIGRAPAVHLGADRSDDGRRVRRALP